MRSIKKFTSGFTLVELMVVVAIVGVLAALGSIGYTRYIRTAQMEELEQIALEVAAGQQRFRSRQNAFYPLNGGMRNWLNATHRDQMTALLEVRAELPPNVRMRVFSWGGGGTGSPTCGFCVAGVGDLTNAGFVVGVQRDYDGTVEADDPMVIVADNLRPVRLNDDQK